MLTNIGICMLPMLFFQLLLLCTIKQKERLWWHESGIVLFSFSIIAILYITGIFPASGFHMHPRGLGYGMNLVPFRGIKSMLGNGFWGVAVNICGNVLLFMPFGLLLPLLWNKNGVIRTTLFGAALSCLVELSQMFLSRSTDIDDLLLNTFGTLLGFLLFRVFRAFAPRIAVRFAAPHGGVAMPWALIGVGYAGMFMLGLFQYQLYLKT